MKIKAITFLLMLSIYGYSQSYQHQWHFAGGGQDLDEIRHVETDSQGNAYMLGSFRGTVDFDPGPAVYNMATTFNHSEPDLFLLKLDKNGNFLWAKQFGSDTDSKERPLGLDLDENNNVYLFSYYKGSIQFTNNGSYWNSGTTVNEYPRPFVVKLDSLGTVQWGRGWKTGLGQEQNWIQPGDIQIDAWGNVYLAGSFEGNFDLDPDPIDTVMRYNTSLENAYIIKLNAQGNYVNDWTAGGVNANGYLSYLKLEIRNNGDVIVAGTIKDTVDFDISPATHKKSPKYGAGNFICKLDSGFNHIWTKVNTIGDKPIYNNVVVSEKGNVYFVGRYFNYVFLDPNLPNQQTLPQHNYMRLYILKLDSLGNTDWIKSFGHPAGSVNIVHDVDIDQEENITLAGMFKNIIDFRTDPNSLPILANGNATDAFVVRYDSIGEYLSHSSFGGSGTEWGRSIAMPNANEVYFAGSFNDTVDFGLGGASQQAISNGDEDFFVLKYTVCDYVSDSIQVTSCGTYTVPSGSFTINQSGLYLDTLNTSASCDSLLYIDATVLPALNPTVTQTIDGLQANTSGNTTCQWLDCSTNQPITGATDSVYMPSVNGQYAVITSNANCTDTSACFDMTNVGLEESVIRNIKLFPNPTTGILNIESKSTILGISIYDLVGREVLDKKTKLNSVDLSTLPKGVYLVKIKTEQGEVVKRVVKE